MRGDGCKYDHDTTSTKAKTALPQPALRPKSIPQTQLQGFAPSFVPQTNEKQMKIVVRYLLTDSGNRCLTFVQKVQPDHVQTIRDNRSLTPFIHYARGTCKKGDSCPYFHSATAQESPMLPLQRAEDSRPKIVCHHFVRGYYKEGNNCPFLHLENSKSQEDAATDDEVRFSQSSLDVRC